MARQLADDVGELQPAGAPPLADQMAVWLTARYLVAVQKLAEMNHNGELDLKVLRELCHDVVALRRGDHSGARLKMEQERLEREREKTEEVVVAHFERWAENQQVRDWICQDWVSPEERDRRLCAILDLEPKTPVAAASADDESNPVKPSQTESDPIQPNPTKNSGAAPSPVEPSPAARS
jgi:hypothetical protein